MWAWFLEVTLSAWDAFVCISLFLSVRPPLRLLIITQVTSSCNGQINKNYSFLASTYVSYLPVILWIGKALVILRILSISKKWTVQLVCLKSDCMLMMLRISVVRLSISFVKVRKVHSYIVKWLKESYS